MSFSKNLYYFTIFSLLLQGKFVNFVCFFHEDCDELVIKCAPKSPARSFFLLPSRCASLFRGRAKNVRKKGENPLAKGRCVCYTKNSRKAIRRMKEVRRWTAAVVRDDGTIDVCFWQEAELWPSCHRSLPAFSEARRHCPTPMRSYI